MTHPLIEVESLGAPRDNNSFQFGQARYRPGPRRESNAGDGQGRNQVSLTPNAARLEWHGKSEPRAKYLVARHREAVKQTRSASRHQLVLAAPARGVG